LTSERIDSKSESLSTSTTPSETAVHQIHHTGSRLRNDIKEFNVRSKT